MKAMLPTRPMNYRELIRTSFNLYSASFFNVLLLAVILSIITFIPRILSDALGQDLFQNLSPFSPHRLWLLLINIIALIFFLAIIWRMHCVTRRKHEPLKEDFRVGLTKVVYVIIASFIQSFIILCAVLLAVGIEFFLIHNHLIFVHELIKNIFAILVIVTQCAFIVYISTIFLFYLPLIAIENKGVFTALGKSVQLSWNHWLRVIITQATPWICYVLVLYIIKYILNINIHIYFTPKSISNIGATMFHILLFSFFIIWIASLLLVQLKDLELRKKLA